MFHSEILSRRRFVTIAASLVAGKRLVHAAQDKEAQNQPDTKFTSDVNVVNVFATVRDSKGHIVQTLTKDDFALAEDDRPQTVRYFAKESSLPLTLGLLVDTSGSQRRVLGQEKDASYKFLDTVLREDKDKAFLIHFDREVELLQDLTPSRKKLESALAGLAPTEDQQQGGWNRGGGGPGGGGPGGGYGGGRGGHGGHHGGGTCLYDSVLLASDELMKKQTGRKALVVLTDGVDNGSKVNLLKAIESAQRADTLVYSILFADPNAYGAMGPGGGRGRWGGGGYPGGRQGSRIDGKPILQRISRMTGGGFFEVSKNDPIDKIYDQIQEELRNQYSLGYTPDPVDGTGAYHRIQLTTKQTGLIVQTRDGYYARMKT